MALILLVVVNVFFTIDGASSGAELVKIENQKKAIASNNQAYSDKIINKSSLQEVSAKAYELGFAKPQDIVYVGDVHNIGSGEVVAKLP